MVPVATINSSSPSPFSADVPPVDSAVQQDLPRPASKPKGLPAHQIYALPAPIRVFPLPSFYPGNPLSLVHLAYVWVSQLLSPPREPCVIHQGTWSKETRSVHVRDSKAIRALWEQGFFGKGIYSRSEPNWLKREQARQGKHNAHVAEAYTDQRRDERKMMKWERARKEQEAILKTRRLEAWVAPVGPKELLALPNSHTDLSLDLGLNGTIVANEKESLEHRDIHTNGKIAPPLNGILERPKRRKSVRFSPTVESTTFELSDPPSPSHKAQVNGKLPEPAFSPLMNGNSPLSRDQTVDLFTVGPPETANTSSRDSFDLATAAIIDREHLQLTPEEAFYLVFGLGVLRVNDPDSGKDMTSQDLFTLFRQASHFFSPTVSLQPDDPFLLHYAVYHHFRSLGWVVRPGVKFGVDWLLYNRGPVFAHAEFAILVLPAYTHSYWKAEGRQPPQKSWHWLHMINRVQANALKTLVLVYVDIPPPSEAMLDPATALTRYHVREFIVRRWVSNRNRD
ncbi:putative tRNA-splicing endonuclease subunit Sen2 [Xylariaceae sp. FL0016]|nr:putative tRNA-splicing endonuclease subunit Sen2 [Xylariaceae sp. FL0016]